MPNRAGKLQRDTLIGKTKNRNAEVYKLNCLDDALEKLRSYKIGIMQDRFTGKKRITTLTNDMGGYLNECQ